MPEDAAFRNIQTELAAHFHDRDDKKHKAENNGKPFFGLRFCHNTEPGAGDGSGTPLWLCSKCYPPEVPDIWSGDPQDKGLMRRVVELNRSDPEDNWGGDVGYSFTLPDHDATRKKGQFQKIGSMGDSNGFESRPISLSIKKGDSGGRRSKVGFSLECWNEDGTMPTDVAAAKEDSTMANKISKVADDGLATLSGLQVNDYILYINGKPTTPGKSNPGMASILAEFICA
jgi:hypothetical protein